MQWTAIVTLLSFIAVIGCSDRADFATETKPTDSDKREPRSLGGSERTEIRGVVTLPEAALVSASEIDAIQVSVVGNPDISTTADAKGAYTLLVPNALIANTTTGYSIDLLAKQKTSTGVVGIQIHVTEIALGQEKVIDAVSMQAYGEIRGQARRYDFDKLQSNHKGIIISNGEETALTDANGDYKLDAAPGIWQLRASLDQYVTATSEPVTVISADTTGVKELELNLNTNAIKSGTQTGREMLYESDFTKMFNECPQWSSSVCPELLVLQKSPEASAVIDVSLIVQKVDSHISLSLTGPIESEQRRFVTTLLYFETPVIPGESYKMIVSVDSIGEIPGNVFVIKQYEGGDDLDVTTYAPNTYSSNGWQEIEVSANAAAYASTMRFYVNYRALCGNNLCEPLRIRSMVIEKLTNADIVPR